MNPLRGLLRLAAVATTAVALTGCASMNVSSYVERGIDISQYRTFDWAPTEGLSTGDPRLDNNRFFDERVRFDVEKGLASRGFERTTAGTPDVLIHYHASITQQIEASEIDRQYGAAQNEDRRPYVYEAGTLLIDLVDPRTNTVVWRGWARDSVDGMIDNQASMEAKVDQAVTRILEKLPRRL
jgi:hypothetical protein